MRKCLPCVGTALLVAVHCDHGSRGASPPTAGGDDGGFSEGVSCADGAGALDAGLGPGPDGAPPAFPVYPLKPSANGRYLVDQYGRPFLVAGDSPQSLVVNVSEQDADSYFANRKSHGFNSVWINLLCADYTAGRPDGSTFDGILPFTSGTNFATPNEKYFQRADHMIALAAKYGLNVFLDPAETGSYLTVMLANGTAASRAFGQYLGDRYKSFDNIVWMSGNDYQSWHEAQNDAVVTALALGIQDHDSRHFHTVELGYPVSESRDDGAWESIISADAAYTYFPTYAEILNGYSRPNPKPVFLVEAVYEFESNNQANTATPATLRRQEYWTDLSGATGQIYGSHYTWRFDSGWQGQLDTPGAAQMAYVKAFFEPRAWWQLVPDEGHSVVTAGYGTFNSSGYVDDNDYATAARTPDGALVVAYLPTIRTVTVDMTKLKGSTTARWFDPSRGTFRAIGGSPFPNTGARSFAPTTNNADGDPDWVLVLESP